jgi:hypothetical protein
MSPVYFFARLAPVQQQQFLVAEPCAAAAKADLGEPGAGARQNREGARADLDVERAVIALLDQIELARAVGDNACEDIKPPGRTLGVCSCCEPPRQGKAFLQFGNVDAAGFQHGATAQIDLVQRHLLKAL